MKFDHVYPTRSAPTESMRKIRVQKAKEVLLKTLNQQSRDAILMKTKLDANSQKDLDDIRLKIDQGKGLIEDC